MLKLIYIGNWVINGIRSDDERSQDFDTIEQVIYEQTKQHGLSHYITNDEESGKLIPSQDPDDSENANALLEKYDEEMFWYEMIHRLAARDFANEYSQQEINDMDSTQRVKIESEYIKKYAEEFDALGVDRLQIQE